MTSTCWTPSSFTTALFVLVLTIGNYASAADQDGLTDDGREVLLNEDGTWEFRSNDRYANTNDGHRVRLKANNTWEYVGNAALTTKTQVRTTTLDIKVQKAEFEIYKKKVQKNVREERQTVFYLDIAVSPAATESVTISNTDLSRILVSDNKGNTYPALSLVPSPLILAPNSKHTVTIRAKGSPSVWVGAKSMELKLAPGVLGNKDEIVFNQKTSDIEKSHVEGFTATEKASR